MRVRTAIAVAAVAAVSIVGCSTDTTSDTERGQVSVVVGSAPTDVSRVLAEIYAGALRRSGLEASTSPLDSGGTSDVDALAAGTVDLVPEFSGDLLAELDPASTARTPEAVFDAVNRSLPEWLSVSDVANAENRESVIVSAPTAESLASATLTDLVPACGASTVAILDAADPADALSPLSEKYGCTFGRQTSASDVGAVRRGLSVNDFQVAVLRATDIGSDAGDDGGNVTLADSDNAYTAQNVLPLFTKGLLAERQTLALGVVAGELTTADLADMVARTRAGDSAAAVADAWLGEQTF